MTCPKCGKPMLDVRGVKTNPKSPDFQCPDASCLNEKGYRTGVWLKAKASPVAAQAPSAPQAHSGPSGNGSRDAQLVELYWRCFDEVLQGLKTRSMASGFPGSEIAACVATMFIARSKIL